MLEIIMQVSVTVFCVVYTVTLIGSFVIGFSDAFKSVFK